MNISSGDKKGGMSQDVELNLAPIIDCFTVLITFMLVSASFLSIGIFDAGINAGASTTTTTPPPISVQVDLKTNFLIEIKVSGKVNKTIPIPTSGKGTTPETQWNFANLNSELAQLKQSWPQTDSIVLNASDEIEYKSLVLAMEQITKVIPGIVLGGF